MELGEGFVLIRGCEFPYKINKEGLVYRYKKGKWDLMRNELQNGNYMVRLKYYSIKNPVPTALHRLLAEAFIPRERGIYYQVKFKDGNRKNIDLENLYWDTVKQVKGRIYVLIINGKEKLVAGSLSDFLRNCNYEPKMMMRVINKEIKIKGVEVYVGTREGNTGD